MFAGKEQAIEGRFALDVAHQRLIAHLIVAAHFLIPHRLEPAPVEINQVPVDAATPGALPLLVDGAPAAITEETVYGCFIIEVSNTAM